MISKIDIHVLFVRSGHFGAKMDSLKSLGTLS